MYHIPDQHPVYRRVVEEGEPYVRRSKPMMIVATGLSGVGLWIASTNLTVDLHAGGFGDRLGNAIFCGPLAALLVWVGVACATTTLRVDADGLRVRNPFRRAYVPWEALRTARVGAFGLRLDTAGFSMPVFVAQLSNAAQAMPRATWPPEALAADLNQIRGVLAGATDTSQSHGTSAAEKRLRLPLPVLAALLAYSAAVTWSVFR